VARRTARQRSGGAPERTRTETTHQGTRQRARSEPLNAQTHSALLALTASRPPCSASNRLVANGGAPPLTAAHAATRQVTAAPHVCRVDVTKREQGRGQPSSSPQRFELRALPPAGSPGHGWGGVPRGLGARRSGEGAAQIQPTVVRRSTALRMRGRPQRRPRAHGWHRPRRRGVA